MSPPAHVSSVMPHPELPSVALGDVAVRVAPSVAADTVPTAIATRFADMDAMRGVLMMLGVVMHAAYIYSPSNPWVVSDPQPSVLLDVFSHYARMFRMPAFFVIAGFFSLMSLRRYGVGNFLRTRLKRIGIPLVCSAVTLNTVQLYLQQRLLSDRPVPLSHFLRTELPQKFIAGEGIQHLWFLNTLLLFFLTAAVLIRFPPPPPFVTRWQHSRVVEGLRKQCRFMLLFPCVMAVWHVIEGLGHGWTDQPLLCGLLCLDDYMFYLPYFLGGMWLYADPKLREQFYHLAPWQIAAIVPSVVVYSLLRQAHGLHSPSFIRSYCEILFTLLTMQSCFVFFRRFDQRESEVFRYLADASYTVYLFHHLWVVVLGAMLLGVPLVPEVKFLLIVASSLCLTLAIHHFLVLRIPLLRLMYNGK